jgi:CheY-like chemotaxis protein
MEVSCVRPAAGGTIPGGFAGSHFTAGSLMTVSGSQQGSLRILIVDDHLDSARSLTRLLRQDGHLVITAHTMTGAMTLVVGQQPVDVVVSDIGLPDGDGCELLRRLRAFYGGRDVPAVAMSGLGDEAWVEDCRRAGYRSFLMKPVTFEQVLSAIRATQAAPAHPAQPAPAAVRPLGGVPAPLPNDS